MSPRSVRRTLLLLPLCLAACREPKVAYYRIPKEVDATPAPMTAGDAAPGVAGPAAGGADMAGTAVPTAEGPGLTWAAPADWESKPASAMRKATYAVPGDGGTEGDLSITAFPGDVGGELANVNRWRGQVQLPPVGEADLPGVVTRLEANGLHVAWMDFGGGREAGSPRLLGAMVPYGGSTWFFKLTGPDALLEKQKPAFVAFLRTLRPADQP